MTSFCVKKVESTFSSVRRPERGNSKPKLRKTILIAIPNSVEFRNYESNKLYRKVIMLQNVSNSSARFQLMARPNYSQFTVMIEPKTQTGNISPGMHRKLIIFFRCDVLDEPTETLVINVQQGRSVIIKLCGYRDPPLLRVKELQTIAKDTKWIIEIPYRQTDSYEEFIDTGTSASDTSTENVMRYRKLKSFDCGECLVGEQVTLLLMIKNVGGEGRFFITSEIDWCSMHIEDVTNNNILILPPFAIWPVYFTLKPQEHIYLYLYFSPDAHGMHMETLYTICNNCSVITIEIIGDGVMYEQ
ncbi:PREDICTED: deleted in lung and esophageal cancer protein 1 homolog isoform X2 [Trachymyrmex septentrionalis]|uniref:deleted in lung and esophageal cancer protein 1 homolog isoform X2 n=1 Tax=Trachymyrmex septentrionalis TaxID=34720 RepID=UPI00084F2C61|nr:PREDICTED: deleted in lung and esophageal cancer protein 1 homolog isoform X2 [Trachymyrmex septentrionalis]